MPLDKFPHLAAMYYYTDVGMDFRNKYSPNKQSSFRLPLNVVGFSDTDLSHFRQTFAINIDNRVSPLATQDRQSLINDRLIT